MLRVAILLPRIDNLGPVKVMQNLVNASVGYNQLDIKVFYFDSTVNDSIKMMSPVIRIYKRNFNFFDFDIIHTNGIRPDLFAYMNRRKIKYHISTVHNLVFEDLRFSYNRIISVIFGNLWIRMWSKADKLICISESMKDYYKGWFPTTKMKVIYNGIDESDTSFVHDNRFLSAVEKFHKQGLKIIGSVGILTKIKGIDLILQLLSVKKEFAFMLIGDGKELGALRRLAAKLKISDRVVFCEFIRNAVACMKYFDFFAMPSRSEGFGLALVEAVQQRVPVICSDISVFRELFTNEEVTFFKSGDSNSLTHAFEDAIESGKSKCESAYNRYRDNYRSDIMAKSYFELYQSVGQ